MPFVENASLNESRKEQRNQFVVQSLPIQLNSLNGELGGGETFWFVGLKID
jgi:hypothetical protein